MKITGITLALVLALGSLRAAPGDATLSASLGGKWDQPWQEYRQLQYSTIPSNAIFDATEEQGVNHYFKSAGLNLGLDLQVTEATTLCFGLGTSQTYIEEREVWEKNLGPSSLTQGMGFQQVVQDWSASIGFRMALGKIW